MLRDRSSRGLSGDLHGKEAITGQMCMVRGDYRGAVEAYCRGIRSNPLSSKLYLFKANALFAMALNDPSLSSEQRRDHLTDAASVYEKARDLAAGTVIADSARRKMGEIERLKDVPE